MDNLHELDSFRRVLRDLIEIPIPSGGTSPLAALNGKLRIFVTAAHDLASQELADFPARRDSDRRSADNLIRDSFRRIVDLTSPKWLTNEHYYGDIDTLTRVWVEAVCKLEPARDRFVYEGGLYAVCLGEGDGPVACCHSDQGKGCEKPTFSIFLTEKDFGLVPYRDGPAVVSFVLKSDNGLALCRQHAPRLITV